MPLVTNGTMPKYILPPTEVIGALHHLKELADKAHSIDETNFDKDLHSKVIRSAVYLAYQLDPSPDKLQNVLDVFMLPGPLFSSCFSIFQKGYIKSSSLSSVELVNRLLMMPFILHATAYQRFATADINTLVLHATNPNRKDKIFDDEDKSKLALKVLNASEFLFQAYQCCLTFGITDKVFNALIADCQVDTKRMQRSDILSSLHTLLSFFSTSVAEAVQKQAVAKKLAIVTPDHTDKRQLIAAIKLNLMKDLLGLLVRFGFFPLLAPEEYEHKFSKQFTKLLRKSDQHPTPDNQKRALVRKYIMKMLIGVMNPHEISPYIDDLVESVSNTNHQLPMFYIGYIGLFLRAVAFEPGYITLQGGRLIKNHSVGSGSGTQGPSKQSKRSSIGKHEIRFWCEYSDKRTDDEIGAQDEVHRMIQVKLADEFEQFSLQNRTDVETNPLKMATHFFVDCHTGGWVPPYSYGLPFSLDHHHKRHDIFYDSKAPNARMSCLRQHFNILRRHPEHHGISDEADQQLLNQIADLLTKVTLFGAPGVDIDEMFENVNDSLFTQINHGLVEEERSDFDSPKKECKKKRKTKSSLGSGKRNKRTKVSTTPAPAAATTSATAPTMTDDIECNVNDPIFGKYLHLLGIDDEGTFDPPPKAYPGTAATTASAPTKTMRNCKLFSERDYTTESDATDPTASAPTKTVDPPGVDPMEVDPMDPLPLNATQSEYSLDLDQDQDFEILRLFEDNEALSELEDATDPLLFLPMVPVH